MLESITTNKFIRFSRCFVLGTGVEISLVPLIGGVEFFELTFVFVDTLVVALVGVAYDVLYPVVILLGDWLLTLILPVPFWIDLL